MGAEKETVEVRAHQSCRSLGDELAQLLCQTDAHSSERSVICPRSHSKLVTVNT